MRLLHLGVLGVVAACHPSPAPAPPPGVSAPPVVLAPAPVASASEDAGVVAPLVVVTPEPEPQGGAPQLRLWQGPAEVTGGLPTEIVQRILRAHFGGFRACVEKQKPAEPRLELTLRFTIGRSGAVASGAKLEVLPTDGGVGRCIARAVEHTRFPEPDRGTVAVVSRMVAAYEDVAEPPNQGSTGQGVMFGPGTGPALGEPVLGGSNPKPK